MRKDLIFMKKQGFRVLLNLVIVTLLLTGCSANSSINSSTNIRTKGSANSSTNSNASSSTNSSTNSNASSSTNSNASSNASSSANSSVSSSANSSVNSSASNSTSASKNSSEDMAQNSIKSEPSATSVMGTGKVLVVYYSLTGNTRAVANIIKDKTGADIFEIKSEFDYYRSDVEDVAKNHINQGFKPKLTNHISNIEEYDTIFIGSPVWWFSISPPVMTFLAQYDLKGKKVIPFCTYGSAYGDFFKQFEEECSGSTVLKSIGFNKSQLTDMDKVKEDIGIWLNEISE